MRATRRTSERHAGPTLHLRAAGALVLALVVAGCAGQRPVEYLDARTGATVTGSGAPLVLFAEDPARAAHARDWLHLATVAVNQSGRLTHWVWLAQWSSIDRAIIGDPEVPRISTVQLLLDDEPMELDFASAVDALPGASEIPYAPPVPTARIRLVPLTASQAARIARARQVAVRSEMTTGPAVLWELWP